MHGPLGGGGGSTITSSRFWIVEEVDASSLCFLSLAIFVLLHVLLLIIPQVLSILRSKRSWSSETLPRINKCLKTLTKRVKKTRDIKMLQFNLKK